MDNSEQISEQSEGNKPLENTAKHFWLIRHAHAGDEGRSDRARKLSARGHKDGELMAGYLASAAARAEHAPGWLVTSSATRAQQTSHYVGRGFRLTREQTIVEPALYLASPESLLSVLRETPDEVGCVALVAHNPGLTWLVNALSGTGEPIDNLPVFGCALFRSTATRWPDVHPTTTARVLLFSPEKSRPKDRQG